MNRTGWRPVLLSAALLLAGGTAPPQGLVLDDFSAPAAWRAEASDGVTASGRPFEGGLRLDYDFSKGSGYAFLRRELPLELPENFELRFRLKGEGAANALELKLVDASGDNVWWHRKADHVPPGEWTTVRVKRRQIEFAWGPAEDKSLRRAAAIEFVVAAGSGGGKGWIAIDDLAIAPLPVPPAVPPPVVASTSGGRDPAQAVDGNRSTAWVGRTGSDIMLDFGYQREFGGLVLRWAPGRHASAYAVQLSDDARQWRVAREVRGGDGGADWIRLEESEARYLRITPQAGPGRRVALAEVEVQPLAFGASGNAFVAAVAEEQRRGYYPRSFIGEQNYWTLLATAEGGESGLIDEGGAIEVKRGGFSVEPFVVEGGELVSWADVEPRQTLRGGDLPIATVEWRRPDWRLAITGFAEKDRLIARYRLSNSGSVPRDLALVLAVRPFQVNPPQQFLNIRGGVSRIETMRWTGNLLMADGRPAVLPASPPDAVKLAAFDSGALPQALERAGGAPVDDPTGLASGALVYTYRLAPGEMREIAVALPLEPEAQGLRSTQDAAAAEEAAAAAWREQLDRVSLSGPPDADEVFATVRSALAQMLMTRQGPALRPGSRAYARSWIRDGAMMSTALLRLGHPQAAIAFLEWYAPFQYPNGKVPCCVDDRGADPVPEHDSDGELIHLVAQVHRYAPDEARLLRMWPRVEAAAGHIETLRQTTRTIANRSGPTRHLYGLLPPSISHEGYSAKPMHSYWDDFWALTGLKDASWIARRLGRRREADMLEARAAQFRADILASLAAARDVHDIDFLPGAADLGDFDPTSTTIALSPAGERHRLDREALTSTFDRYWREFVGRRDGHRPWDAYTPYEWRNVGAFVRLGWRERASALTDFFMSHRRPAGWNQWAEVVGRELREPRFLGDMPHGWVASDFVNAVLDMIAYERPSDQALVLAAGVPSPWLANGGISVEKLRTPYGLLDYSLRVENGRGTLRYSLDGVPPPGGLVLVRDTERRLPGLSGTVRFRAR